ENGGATKPVLAETSLQAELARKKIAKFMNADLEEIAFIRSVAEGVNMITHGLALEAGDEVITTNQENIAIILALSNLEKIKGIKVKRIELHNNDTEAILDNLEKTITSRTKLLVLSHVTYTKGLRLPAKEICEVAHKNNIAVMFDGAQSAGQFPIDLKEMDCDFYAAAGYKWLLGFHGTSILYIKKQWLDQVNPMFIGDGSQSKFDFTTCEYELYNQARKFEFGSRHLPLYAALGASIEFIEAFGISNIENRIFSLATRRKNGLSEIREITIESPLDNKEISSGITTFTSKTLDAEEFVEWLWQEKNILAKWIYLSDVGSNIKGVRVSVDFFNSEGEVDYLLNVTKSYLKKNVK
ncbi:MAG: aminotransferase class V-fold PLP-dependent enzyme, partial [Tepidanaerobacteraceae bacterium]|nr:aminotransferase class V-fold PLP-dependent enzyme [Tepidanaerobacteraceae bacterium]